MAANPHCALLEPDVEALLVRAPDRGRGTEGDDFTCHLVPIDACYELVGQLRRLWRGFDGGQEAHQAMDAFFARCRPAAGPAPPADRGAG